MSNPPLKRKKLSKEWHERFPDKPKKYPPGPHITVARIGTQYDPEEVVCIHMEAQEILLDALYAERNEIESAVEFWLEQKDMETYDYSREKLKICNSLISQVEDMRTCD